MKKKIVYCFLGLIIFLLITVIAAVIVSFTVVLPLVKTLNEKLSTEFTRVILIPSGVVPQMRFFETYLYWEMETKDNETVGVQLRYNPDYLSSSDKIPVSLQMSEGGDPSIFNKVLPALISDTQTLFSAQDPQKANLGSNPQAGYDSIELLATADSGQVAKISWLYSRSSLSGETLEFYEKINKYPDFLFKILFSIQSLGFQLMGI